MTAIPAPATVSVIGGSVIGLACAWRLARAGYDVVVHQPGGLPATDGAGWVAGGMLGAYSEAWPGEGDALALGVASLRRWGSFVAELEADSPGVAEPTVTGRGCLMIAVDEADADDLRVIREEVEPGHPGAIRVVTRREIRGLEPALRRGVRAGAFCAAEDSVDNRVLLRRLAEACARAGVRHVDAVVPDADAVARLAAAGPVVVAAGNGVRALTGLPVRPVKGEVLRLRRRPGCEPAPTRTIRGRVHGRALYLVPRGDGLAIGATQYEHGDDTEPTAGGVRQLLDDAELLFPGVEEYAFVEVIAGLRPTTPDNLPVIGRLAGPGVVGGAVGAPVVVAGGHGRNGVLLTPVTADAVLAELRGEPLAEVACAAPGRFGG